MFNYIILFNIKGNSKYLSHLDLMRLFRQVFRRTNIPINFSEGFSPHMKISFARAKSVGLESNGELMEIEIRKSIKKEILLNLINKNLIKGIKILKIIKKNNIKKSISTLIDRAEYQISFPLINLKKCNNMIKNINNYFNKKNIFIEIIKKNKKIKKDFKKDILKFQIKIIKKIIYIKILGICNNEKNLKINALANNLSKEIKFYKYNIKIISFYNNENKSLLDIL